MDYIMFVDTWKMEWLMKLWRLVIYSTEYNKNETLLPNWKEIPLQAKVLHTHTHTPLITLFRNAANQQWD